MGRKNPQQLLVFDDGAVVPLQPGDTITVPPNVWHESICEGGGKMLTIFKNGRFDQYLERLAGMTKADFADGGLMTASAAEFDIYE